MSATPGWYPDPQGGYGRLRYWDGQSWTEHTTVAPTTPQASTPHAWAQPAPAPPMPTPPVPPPPAAPATPNPYAVPGTVAPSYDQLLTPRRRWPIFAAVGGILVLVLGVGFLGSRLAGDSATAAGRSAAPSVTMPAPAPTVEGISCAPARAQSPAGTPSSARVAAGGLSYPAAPEPFGAPDSQVTLPLSARAAGQSVKVADYRGGGWYAAVVVAGIDPTVQFNSPEQAATVVAGCMVATQYEGPAHTARQTRSQAETVGGKPAWTIETDISLNDPALQVSHELMLLTVVRTGASSYAMFWASIPQVSPDLTPAARACRTGLAVG